MKLVTVVEKGYHGSIRRPGQQFMVEDDERSTWFHGEGETPLEKLDIDGVLEQRHAQDNAEIGELKDLKAENKAIKKMLEKMEAQLSDLKKTPAAPKK